MGPDDVILKVFWQEGNKWLNRGVRGLRKKTEGQRIMASTFQDKVRSFGVELAEQELKDVYEFRTRQGRKELALTPGTRFVEYSRRRRYIGRETCFVSRLRTSWIASMLCALIYAAHLGGGPFSWTW